MPIILTCPFCQKRSKVADQQPGSAVRCPHCSSVMRVPGAKLADAKSSASKVVAQSPRAVSATSSAAAPPIVVPPVMTTPRMPPLLSPLPPSPAVEDPGYVCCVCSKSFTIDQVYDLNGQNICESCHAATSADHTIDREDPVTPNEANFPAVPSVATMMAQPPALNYSATDDPAIEGNGQPSLQEIGPDAGSVPADLPADTIGQDDIDLSEPSPTSYAPTKRVVKRKSPVSMIVGGGIAILLGGGPHVPLRVPAQFREARFGGECAAGTSIDVARRRS